MALPILAIGAVVFPVLKSLFTGGSFMSSVDNIIDAVAKNEMSASEAKAKTAQAWAGAWAEAEKQYAKSSEKAFGHAQETIRSSFEAQSWLARNAWAFVVISQTLVLLWYQVGLPWVVWLFDIPLTGPGSIPRTGDGLLQWAYALVAGALGIGVIKGNLSGFMKK